MVKVGPGWWWVDDDDNMWYAVTEILDAFLQSSLEADFIKIFIVLLEYVIPAA